MPPSYRAVGVDLYVRDGEEREAYDPWPWRTTRARAREDQKRLQGSDPRPERVYIERKRGPLDAS